MCDWITSIAASTGNAGWGQCGPDTGGIINGKHSNRVISLIGHITVFKHRFATQCCAQQKQADKVVFFLFAVDSIEVDHRMQDALGEKKAREHYG